MGEKYGFSRFAMKNLRKQFKQEKAEGKRSPGESCRRFRKRRDLTTAKEKLQDVPLKLRTTQKAVAAAVGLSQATFARHMDDLGLKKQTCFLKPKLTVQGKIDRL